MNKYFNVIYTPNNIDYYSEVVEVSADDIEDFQIEKIVEDTSFELKALILGMYEISELEVFGER